MSSTPAHRPPPLEPGAEAPLGPLYGLTGGIACGKSTVAARFSALGAVVIDADAVAREVVAPGTPGLAELVAAFGADILGPEGALDRARLGARVFGDPAARARLDALLHPRIAEASIRRIFEARRSGAPATLYDAALLFETGRAEAFRPVVVVSVPPEVQRARLMARDALTAEAAEARIAAQMPLSEKVARADHVIDNGGTRAQTEAQVDALWARWSSTCRP